MREALRELEATGLVTNIPRRGTYVAEVMGEGLREIYTVRGALEEQATRIVTRRGSCDLAVLQREVDLMREAAVAGDVHGMIEHSVKFHRADHGSGAETGCCSTSGSRCRSRRGPRSRCWSRGSTSSKSPTATSRSSMRSPAAMPKRRRSVAREHQDYFERLPVPTDPLFLEAGVRKTSEDSRSCRDQAVLSNVYRDYIDYLNKQDWPRLGQFVHDGAIHNGRQIGLSGYLEMLERDFDEIADLYFNIDMLIADPPYIASRLASTVRQRERSLASL